ncbi:hypothetical protein Tdes44962_MAKER04808 [Teratosphaeria destructans]|uniref:Uncharacterized protein n=1 Tax=Teratosphaeria destructans TaxID=418781 RepID=A0A9W7SLA2_9PEZI|nr:hypothetical protein Tdes44962_MAKER04808 [Teratosphaeria destructans]
MPECGCWERDLVGRAHRLEIMPSSVGVGYAWAAGPEGRGDGGLDAGGGVAGGVGGEGLAG